MKISGFIFVLLCSVIYRDKHNRSIINTTRDYIQQSIQFKNSSFTISHIHNHSMKKNYYSFLSIIKLIFTLSFSFLVANPLVWKKLSLNTAKIVENPRKNVQNNSNEEKNVPFRKRFLLYIKIRTLFRSNNYKIWKKYSHIKT